MSDDAHKPDWLERLSQIFSDEPQSREHLLHFLHAALDNKLLDSEALTMIEGVLQVSEMTVRNIMIPVSQMDVIDINDRPEEFIPSVIETAHSRFPVIEGNRNNVIGIMLAKDLLRLYAEDEFDLRDMLRPAIFIPESKRLNVLLKDFRSSRNHIAIVVDEYGGVAGMVTIEDVLEQIVGDIEDEYDFDETEDNIIEDGTDVYRIKALTEIADCNQALGMAFPEDEFTTIGGLVTSYLHHVPKPGEQVCVQGWRFIVLRADSRRIYTLRAERLPDEAVMP